MVVVYLRRFYIGEAVERIRAGTGHGGQQRIHALVVRAFPVDAQAALASREFLVLLAYRGRQAVAYVGLGDRAQRHIAVQADAERACAVRSSSRSNSSRSCSGGSREWM